MSEGWWWLSFCDPKRTKGEKFLGVAIVRGRDAVMAISEAWRLGVNPGGEIFMLEIPDDEIPPARFRERLLSREEIQSNALTRL